MIVTMKYFLFLIVWSSLFSSLVSAFTENITETSYHFNPDEIFPSPRTIPSAEGIGNVNTYVVGFIPFLTTLWAIGATLMLVLWGFYMVTGGASSEQTEKGKSVIKDALIGLTIGLVAYVIIITVWNLLDI